LSAMHLGDRLTVTTTRSGQDDRRRTFCRQAGGFSRLLSPRRKAFLRRHVGLDGGRSSGEDARVRANCGGKSRSCASILLNPTYSIRAMAVIASGTAGLSIERQLRKVILRVCEAPAFRNSSPEQIRRSLLWRSANNSHGSAGQDRRSRDDRTKHFQSLQSTTSPIELAPENETVG
jgi:hypothetical protein